MERGIVHFDPFPKILFSPSVFSRLGFSSCLLLLHFDCRLPAFLVETWTASYFWARLRQRTAPRLPASHIFKKESYFQLCLYRLAANGQKQPTLMLHILRLVADQTGATSIIIIHHLHHHHIHLHYFHHHHHLHLHHQQRHLFSGLSQSRLVLPSVSGEYGK